MPRNGTITPRQRRLIEYLVAGQNITQACQLVGVGRRTYYRWAKQDAFKAALAAAEAELLTSAMRKLLNRQDAAIEALFELVADRRLPGVRLQAARAVLDNVMRYWNAARIVQRLAELERKLAEMDNEHSPQV